jgi:release factor glutamine methyltransferase
VPASAKITVKEICVADVRSALKEGIARLRASQVPSHALAAELLLMHALGRDRTWLYSHPEAAIDPSAVEIYFALIARRAAGEPTQYLTGKQEFWGLEFEVNPNVLIPRPETEHIVEVALERLGPGGPNAALRVADVGTGSGCIAVALACELPHATVVATDISAGALEVARKNAVRHGVSDRIQFVETDLLESVLHESQITPDGSGHEPRPFDLIVSNPPYVSREEAASLPQEVREHEPHRALFGGAAGTEIYVRLIEQAFPLLGPGGVLILELGHNSVPCVRQLLTEKNGWTDVRLTNDLAGIPRVIAAARTAT